MVTQSGSGSWLFSSSWEQGTWLLLFRGSGVQGRWGPGGVGSMMGSRGDLILMCLRVQAGGVTQQM